MCRSEARQSHDVLLSQHLTCEVWKRFSFSLKKISRLFCLLFISFVLFLEKSILWKAVEDVNREVPRTSYPIMIFISIPRFYYECRQRKFHIFSIFNLKVDVHTSAGGFGHLSYTTSTMLSVMCSVTSLIILIKNAILYLFYIMFFPFYFRSYQLSK